VPVYVVGSVNVDLTLPVAELPAPGATILAGDPIHTGGGKGANVAVAAARDGAQVRMVGAVGDDEAGRTSLAELQADRVDTQRVTVLAGRPTGLAVICLDARGENHIVVAPGANSGLTPELVEEGLAALRAGDVCVVNFEIPEGAGTAAAAAVAAVGATLVVNPSPVRPVAAELLSAAPILVANAGELGELTGEEAVEAGAAALQRRGATAVVATLGAAGAYVRAADGTGSSVAAYPAAAVDTTGAGDTFTGVLAAGLAAGVELARAVERAAAAAALSTEQIGARTAMPATDVIESLVADRLRA
jgi:ribokinase